MYKDYICGGKKEEVELYSILNGGSKIVRWCVCVRIGEVILVLEVRIRRLECVGDAYV